MAYLPVHTAGEVLLHTFPETSLGVVRSELNYSVILGCLAWTTPTPVIYWTFNGQPRGTGEKLIIRQLSREDLGTYMCVAKDNQEQYSSESVDVSLPGKSPSPTPTPCTKAGRWPVFLVPLNPLL